MMRALSFLDLFFLVLVPFPEIAAREPVPPGKAGVVEAVLTAENDRIHTGKIELSGTEYEVWLFDRNGNGRFDDALRFNEPVDVRGADAFGQCDILMLDTGEPPDFRDQPAWSPGVLSRPGNRPWATTLAVGSLVSVEGRFFSLHVAPSGSRIAFRPISGPLGSVTSTADRWEAYLLGDAGMVQIRGRGGEARPLPAGKWWVVCAYLESVLVDEAGRGGKGFFMRKNCLLATGTKESPPFDVRAGKTALLPFGPPYRPVVKARGARSTLFQGRRTVILSLELVGRGGERVEALYVNGRRPRKAPVLFIRDAAGQVVHRARFEYG